MEFKRDIHLKRLIASRHNRLIKVVTGIRRSGKSYLLRILFKDYLIDNGTKEDHIIDLDLENRRNKKYRDPDALLEYIDNRMVDEDIPCEDILSQLNAAKSALHKCGQVVLEGHIKHCVRDGIEHGDADKTIEDFTKAVERFANMG